MPTVIDCDQHLFEPRGLWSDYAGPAGRAVAIRMEDDALGHTHLVWNGRRMGVAQVQVPGDTDAVGRYLADVRAGRPARAHYDELVPPAYSQPGERLRILDAMGVDETVLFPNYGLAWEHVLRDDLDALRVNMGAWNRFAMDVAAEGKGRLHPVAHLTLRDASPDRAWLEGQLAALSAAGVRLAMVGPGLVDGKPLSHPELDRAWAAFVHHGISPVFHVANVERPFADAWYTDAYPEERDAAGASDAERIDLVLSSVFLWTGVALGLADLTINGVLHRHPDLRLGIMELSAPWLPMFLMYLDGGIEFTTRLNGRARFDYAMKPSEYVRQHVRIAGFSYERPDRLARRVGDLFMACSDWPHTEGSAHPLEDYRKLGGEDCTPAAAPGLFGANLAWLLRRETTGTPAGAAGPGRA